MRRTFALLLLSACFASSSLADPLDDWCKTARLPSSVALCSDPELRALAQERQRAFDEARARLSPEEQKALLADQDAWVRSYARACGLSDTPPALPLAPQIKSCMARAGEARIAYLRAYGSPTSAHAAQTPPPAPTPPSPSEVGATTPARIGPSFNCGQATQPLARTICASPWLSKLDLRFAQAYYALLQQVGPAGRSLLRQEAVDFTNSVVTECGIPETGPARRARHCVAQRYRRQRSVWISRLQGPAYEEATRPIRQHIALEAQLQRLGYLPIGDEIHGIYGPAVRSAILAWQGVNGRPGTGFLSDADAAALEAEPKEAKGIAPPAARLAPPVSSPSLPPSAPEGAPPAAPAVTGRASIILGSWSGNGDRNTRPFHAPGPWELRWRSGGFLAIVIRSVDGNMFANASGNGGPGESYVPKGGDFYLEVASGTGAWNLSAISAEASSRSPSPPRAPATAPPVSVAMPPGNASSSALPPVPVQLPAKVLPSSPATPPAKANQEAEQATAESANQLPSDEQAFITVVSEAHEKYNAAPNDMAKGGVRAWRKEAICQALPSSQVADWLGTIYSLSSSSDGDGVVEIKIAPDIYVQTMNNAFSDIPYNTLIPPTSEVFKTLSRMQKGDRILFSGEFPKSDVDCVVESSLTQEGSMTEPEFLFKFSSISISPVSQ